jgi:integrase
MAFTGMRRGEALALRWSDFDPATKTLRIEQALEYTRKHGLQFKEPKSKRSKRTIKLDDTLVALLIRMRERYQRVVAGAPDGVDVDLSLVRVPDDWLIFPAPTASPTSRATPTASRSSSPTARRRSWAFQSVSTISEYRTGLGYSIRGRRCTWSQKGLAMTLASCSRSTLRGRRRATSQQPRLLAS